MKKLKNKSVSVLCICIALFLTISGCAFGATEIKPGDLQSDSGEYELLGIEWGTPIEEVKEALPFGITEDQYTGGYVGDKKVRFNGNTAEVTINFYKDAFMSAMLDFEINDDHMEWAEKTAEAIEKELGTEPEYRTQNSALTGTPIHIYTWKTEETVLVLDFDDRGEDSLCRLGLTSLELNRAAVEDLAEQQK